MVWRVCCTASSMAWSKAVPAGMSQALQQRGVAGRFQLPGQPLGPGAVGLRVADEEVPLLVWLVHPARPAPYGLS
jgi:hypothetical protein